jgi:hypothetical protein
MENGKLSLDLLMGLSIFLFTFIFVANFLPGVFADVRNEINLANQAYRISTLLVEDPGYSSSWYNITEDRCRTEEFRPGLAVYDLETGVKYNNLSVEKIQAFARLLNNTTCIERVRFYLGLNLSTLGGQVFRFNVSLKNLAGDLVTYNRSVLLNHGDKIPVTQVVRFERIVYLDKWADNCNVTIEGQNVAIADRCVAKLEVSVWI